VSVVGYITINIDPIIGHLGPFTIRWYGVIMSLATVVGCAIFARQLGRRGIALEHALGIAVVGIPCAVLGARLFSVLDNIRFYWHYPGQIFGTALVGLAIYGVLAGGLGALVVYCRWKKLPVLRVLDATALAFPVGQLIGRCANIINGDTWGPATKLPWGFIYRNPNVFLPADLLGVPTHPTPVYEQLWLLVMLVLLWRLIPHLKTEGMAFLAYLGLYSLGRFFISFYRVNNIILLGLREAQLLALAVLILVLPAAYWLRRRARARLVDVAPDADR
jgi:phosphatidylglycerol:prolipoprotein diacylglycerol transferase